MLTILGPAKTLDMSSHGVTCHHSTPCFLDQAEELVKLLQRYSPAQLKDLMQVSDKLATLTFERYMAWHRDLRHAQPQERRHRIARLVDSPRTPGQLRARDGARRLRVGFFGSCPPSGSKPT